MSQLAPSSDGSAQTISRQDCLIYTLPSILEPLDLSQLFRCAQPLEVELGCGDASFLLNYARANPQLNLIGVERLLGRIKKLDRKGQRLGLTNLRGVRIESGYFLQYLLPHHSAQALHVYFADPWPKLKHRRHRFINDDFPRLAQLALRPMGKVYLRTDDGDYFAQMLNVFSKCKQFSPAEGDLNLLGIKTDFEAEFNARGIPTRYATFQLVD